MVFVLINRSPRQLVMFERPKRATLWAILCLCFFVFFWPPCQCRARTTRGSPPSRTESVGGALGFVDSIRVSLVSWLFFPSQQSPPFALSFLSLFPFFLHHPLFLSLSLSRSPSLSPSPCLTLFPSRIPCRRSPLSLPLSPSSRPCRPFPLSLSPPISPPLRRLCPPPSALLSPQPYPLRPPSLFPI